MEIVIKVRRQQVDVAQCFSSCWGVLFCFVLLCFWRPKILERSKTAPWRRKWEWARGGARGSGIFPPPLLSNLLFLYLLKTSPAKGGKTFSIYCCTKRSVFGSRQFWIPNSTTALEWLVLNPLSLYLIIDRMALKPILLGFSRLINTA